MARHRPYFQQHSVRTLPSIKSIGSIAQARGVAWSVAVRVSGRHGGPREAQGHAGAFATEHILSGAGGSCTENEYCACRSRQQFPLEHGRKCGAALRIAILSTPRTGNTWLRRMSDTCTRYPRLSRTTRAASSGSDCPNAASCNIIGMPPPSPSPAPRVPVPRRDDFPPPAGCAHFDLAFCIR